MPPPTYIPTWWIGCPKKTRSPGWSWSVLTCLNEAYWSAAECAMTTPACRHEDIVRPEQSNVSGPAPAQTYRLPICAIAARTATAAWSDEGMAGKASEDPEELDEPEGLGELEDLVAAWAAWMALTAMADRTAAARSAAAFAAAMRLASVIW